MKIVAASIFFTLGIIFSGDVVLGSDAVDSLDFEKSNITPKKSPGSKKKVLKDPTPPPNIDLNLCRKIGANVSGRYFLNTSDFRFLGTSVSNQLFLTSPLCHVNKVENLLQTHRTAFGNSGLSRNHLLSNIYALVNDTTDDQKKVIQGTLHARKVADAGEAGGSSEIMWSVRPNDAGHHASFHLADFMSSSYADPNPGNLVNTHGCLPLSRADILPLNDVGNHSDKLALDALSSNVDLFFSLIRKTAHREDLQIISMGSRYFSSYDACDACHTEIHGANGNMRQSLTHYAQRKNYAFFEDDTITGLWRRS